MNDGCEGFSYCMNYTYDSPGCIKIKLDNNKWDYLYIYNLSLKD